MPGIFFPSSKPIFIDIQATVQKLKELALEIARRFSDIQAIYLFGSYAQGEATPRSDADVLVILQGEGNVGERIEELMIEFTAAPLPVDVIVLREREVEKLRQEKTPFILNVLSGICLYKRKKLE